MANFRLLLVFPRLEAKKEALARLPGNLAEDERALERDQSWQRRLEEHD